MAVNLYTGVMGAGKTHEAVKELVLVHSRLAPGAARSRGIVCNISGLDVDKVSAMLGHDCTRHVPSSDPIQKMRDIAQGLDGASGIQVVSYERVTEPHFFPTEQEVLSGNTSHCIVQPGDLVILDEAWRYYQPGMKVPPEHMEFLRMHRHMAHPATGVTCDMAVLIQDLGTLDRKVKNVVESVYKFKKHRAAGLNSRYLVQQFDGNSTRLSNLVNTWQRKYDPVIFPLYKSHTSSGAVEKNIDRRAVFWKDPKFIALMVGAGLFAVLGPIFAYRMLNNMAGPKSKPAQVAQPQATGQATGSPQPPTSGGAAAPAAPKPTTKRPPLRVAGSIINQRGERWVLVDGGDGVVLVPEQSFQGTGVGFYGTYQGQAASTWGGSVPATRKPDGGGKSIF